MNDATLSAACMHGRRAAAAWLAGRFGLTADDARVDANYALRKACEYGRLEIATWLADTFGLAAADASMCT